MGGGGPRAAADRALVPGENAAADSDAPRSTRDMARDVASAARATERGPGMPKEAAGKQGIGGPPAAAASALVPGENAGARSDAPRSTRDIARDVASAARATERGPGMPKEAAGKQRIWIWFAEELKRVMVQRAVLHGSDSVLIASMAGHEISANGNLLSLNEVDRVILKDMRQAVQACLTVGAGEHEPVAPGEPGSSQPMDSCVLAPETLAAFGRAFATEPAKRRDNEERKTTGETMALLAKKHGLRSAVTCRADLGALATRLTSPRLALRRVSL